MKGGMGGDEGKGKEEGMGWGGVKFVLDDFLAW